MKIAIKPLTPDLTKDYLDFFDNRAFSGNNPNGPCYCNAPIMDTVSIRQMESEFGNDVKGVLRRYAVKQLAEGKIFGYLAFQDDISIGWCNVGNMEDYSSNDFQFIPDFARQSTCGKTMSIVCFAIASEYCGKGVASALMERIIADARAMGYAAVEGYPYVPEERDNYDYKGPMHLYEKFGFVEVQRIDGRVVMRRKLL